MRIICRKALLHTQKRTTVKFESKSKRDTADFLDMKSLSTTYFSNHPNRGNTIPTITPYPLLYEPTYILSTSISTPGDYTIPSIPIQFCYLQFIPKWLGRVLNTKNKNRFLKYRYFHDLLSIFAKYR